jgi:hypothetical protein
MTLVLFCLEDIFLDEKKKQLRNSLREVIGFISIVLMILSLWCLWRSVIYGRPVNIIKYSVLGVVLNLGAIIAIKRLRCFSIIPAYVLMALLIGNLGLILITQIHKRYYGTLYDAIRTGNANLVQRKINEGYDVNAKSLTKPIVHFVFTWFVTGSRYEPYPPKDVCEKKMVEMLEVLIDNGANVNSVDDVRGWSPLFLAVTGYRAKVVEFLVKKGADVNLADKKGRTPLHLSETPMIAQILIDNGAHVDARSKDGNTKLHMVPPLDVAQILVDHGADVNAKNKEGKTPLDLAIKEGYQELVEFLRKHGAKE